MKIDPELVVPDAKADAAQGRRSRRGRSRPRPITRQTLEALGKHYKFRLDTPWQDLPKKARDVILYGSGDEEIRFSYDDGLRAYDVKKPFEGVIPNLERRYKETESDWAREEIARFMSETPCAACDGYRLKPEALAVKIDGRHIGEVSCMSVQRRARLVRRRCPQGSTRSRTRSPARILKEIRERLAFLVDVGLDYLTLARASGTLSGGESQRIRLASQIGSGLTGVLYVLDEPSIGLHQRDNERLLDTLRRLRDLGNTVIVVEHDEDAILHGRLRGRRRPRRRHPWRADRVAGHARARSWPIPKSLTGQVSLRPQGGRCRPRRGARRSPSRKLKIVGATGNNLKNVTAEIPLGTFTCVTGVSGGGKSTLIIDTLYKAVARGSTARWSTPPRTRRSRGSNISTR